MDLAGYHVCAYRGICRAHIPSHVLHTGPCCFVMACHHKGLQHACCTCPGLVTKEIPKPASHVCSGSLAQPRMCAVAPWHRTRMCAVAPWQSLACVQWLPGTASHVCSGSLAQDSHVCSGSLAQDSHVCCGSLAQPRMCAVAPWHRSGLAVEPSSRVMSLIQGMTNARPRRKSGMSVLLSLLSPAHARCMGRMRWLRFGKLESWEERCVCSSFLTQVSL